MTGACVTSRVRDEKIPRYMVGTTHKKRVVSREKELPICAGFIIAEGLTDGAPALQVLDLTLPRECRRN